MSDLINRQDAIDALTEANIKRHMDSVEGGQENRSAIRIIMELPSAERKGEWLETSESIGWEEVGCAECSVCGKTLVLGDYTMDDIKFNYNYCPNCGAEMKND